MDRLLQALAETALSIGESQKQIGESQKQMEILSHRISGTDDTAKSSQFANLATWLGKFVHDVHDPTRGKTFALWFERHRSTFVERTKGLTDTECKEYFLNALGDDEYQQLLSRLSPKKSQEMSLGDLQISCNIFENNSMTIKSYFNVVLKFSIFVLPRQQRL
ncbi:hypothetical protein EAG_01866 [Camponotus floridanus]|uniref:DUF7083 domain-containing protein n=1 Tax=Camponotus floridanus TaxID=104421 RepID=E2AJG2_CAMFO|nr:hypothetical protein EAG_01866 [Camponotus floridanus]